ncbi:MAG: hypothetical protein LBG11_06905 [Bifidobacteriaceae bacterium]|jgi:hypothetical protein|nr:hypothetical protein [Bifidobacteriaceae bacterium]
MRKKNRTFAAALGLTIALTGIALPAVATGGGTSAAVAPVHVKTAPSGYYLTSRTVSSTVWSYGGANGSVTSWNGTAGYNFYNRVDNWCSRSYIYLRWVKSTAYANDGAASSTQGTKYASTDIAIGPGPFQGALGTNFKAGSGIQTAMRKRLTSDPNCYHRSEQYFNNKYIF